jgi:hypothetical protein
MDASAAESTFVLEAKRIQKEYLCICNPSFSFVKMVKTFPRTCRRIMVLSQTHEKCYMVFFSIRKTRQIFCLG